MRTAIRTVLLSQPKLLLDKYPGASAAYSLKKLSNKYKGACIRARRSSDNAEKDIGFVRNTLDTANLLSFAGTDSVFITTWYEPNAGKHLFQPTPSQE